MTEQQIKDFIDDSEDSMKDRYLTFLIGEDTFGIELNYIMEIVGLQPITEMPEMPDYIKGIVNLRGMIIPVMDVRLRLKKPQAEYNDRTCIIITQFGGMSLGLVVDSVSDVRSITSAEISDKPDIGGKGSRGYVKSVAKIHDRVILLLDCEKLLTDEEPEEVSGQ